jgi:hypothetical protein
MKSAVGAGLRAARLRCLSLPPELAGKLEGAAPVGATFIVASLYARHHIPQGPAMVLILAGLFGPGIFYALRRQGLTGLLEAVFQGICVGGAAAGLISLLIPKTPLQSIIGGLWTLGIWAYVIPATLLCCAAGHEEAAKAAVRGSRA